MVRKNSLVIGLDVGTYKIGVIVAEAAESGVEIVGIGTAASKGLRRGVVNNIEKTVEAIRKAIEEAELMAACEIRTVVAGRSEERRVGKECRSRWWRYHEKKNKNEGKDSVSRC